MRKNYHSVFRRKNMIIVLLLLGLLTILTSFRKYSYCTETVPTKDVYRITTPSGNTLNRESLIEGIVKMNKAETIASVSTVQINNTLYIEINKRKHFIFSTNKFEFDFKKIKKPESISKVILLGESTYTNDTNSNEIVSSQFPERKDKIVIWESK